jgi:hypothetical protein
MKDYSDLPEYMTVSEIAFETDKLLDKVNNNNTSKQDVANALVELVYRQSNTRQPYAENVTQRIEEWVLNVWSEDTLELTDALCTVIANLDTPKLRQLIEDASHSSNEKVRDLANETLRDMPLTKAA